MTSNETLARVIVASNRAAAGVYSDRTGPIIAQWLGERGHSVGDPIVVPDGEPVGEQLRAAVAAGVHVVVTTGGTGISPTDRTPEITRTVLDYEIPGLADAVRAAGLPAVPTAVLSRGVAGVGGRTLIVNLPGSTGGVRDGLGVLDGVLAHALSQLAGGDHAAAGSGLAQPPAPNAKPAAASPHDGQAHDIRNPGPARIARAEVLDAPLSVEEHAELVADDTAGAVVTFGGVVRDHDHGRGVRDLEYVGHPSATEVIGNVAAELAERYSGVCSIAVSHRVGHLKIGDVALACAVAAEHRREAFAACSDLVDEVKRLLPIWKRQSFADGTEEWVNCP